MASCGANAVVKDSSLTKRSRGTCRRTHSKSTPVSFFIRTFFAHFFRALCFTSAFFERRLHATPHAHEKRHGPSVACPLCLLSSDSEQALGSRSCGTSRCWNSPCHPRELRSHLRLSQTVRGQNAGNEGPFQIRHRHGRGK